MTRNILHVFDAAFAPDNLHEYVYEVCHEMDIPSPLILKTHIRNFEEFNMCKFKTSDYVESIDFDEFTIEFVVDPDKKKQKDLRFYP